MAEAVTLSGHRPNCPHEPCPRCGGKSFYITSIGSVRCWGCTMLVAIIDMDRFTDMEEVTFREKARRRLGYHLPALEPWGGGCD